MIPNPVQAIADFINSALAPIPGFARGYVVILGLGAVFWALGAFTEESSDDAIGQIRQGISVSSSGLNRFAEVSAPLVSSGTMVGGKTLASVTGSVGREMWRRGSTLVEVEEAPIKVGPLVEIYGVRIGLIGLLVGLLGFGGLAALAGGIPLVP
ncbi:hypothetical protein [Halorarum salinum]|uniref:Uncharacterized protein n=1 Tax=Halorarum salinum TaxID=2743089 RepID=A0A7D5LCT9_9EURY|nr:hypothetical protein [Halobaculum salinum]QLG63327.1 hypothetical protein HUG12_16950 [Halobaculum salinum]